MKNAVILGTFDGLHSGHRAVIEKAKGFNIIAVTFKAPPKKAFDSSLGVLMPFDDKVASLKELGVSFVDALDFNEVCDTSPLEFLDLISKKHSPDLFVCGFNYRFGKGAKGDITTLSEYCDSNGIELRVAESVNIGSKTVSSTLIREYLSKGEIKLANSLLYKPFGFKALVVGGDKRGRTLGFPTINQTYPEELQKVKSGVYSSKVFIDGKEYKAISNIGLRPTFKTDSVVSESYILDFDGDLYGKTLRIEPKRFLRDEHKFYSVEELKAAITADIESLSKE